MAIELKTAYQLVSTIKLTYGEVRTYAKYYEQDKTTNETEYKVKDIYYIPNQSYVAFGSANASLMGESKDYGYTTFYKGETLIQETTRTIKHKDDGSSPEISVETSWNASFGGSGSTSATIKMPKIQRTPAITKADDFNDEDDPIIEFTNPAEFKINGSLAFSYTDQEDMYINGVTINRTNITSPYTFDLTDAERTKLRTTLNDRKEYTVKYTLQAFDSDNKYIGEASIKKKFTFINAEPTFTSSLVETDAKVISILGSSASKLIKNASKVKTTIVPTAKKSATIKSVAIIHGTSGVVLNESPYEQSFIALTNTFEVVVTDSRGYAVSETIKKDLIDYSPIEISKYSFKRVEQTSSNIVLSATIKYMQQTFNSTSNKPTLKWKLGENGTLNTISSSNYSIDTANKEITIDNLILSNILPYTEQGRLYLVVNDLLTEDSESYLIAVGIPVADYGKHDFQINGDLFIADRDRKNKKSLLDFVYPVGSYYETDNEEFDPNTYWGGTWVLDSVGRVTVSQDTSQDEFKTVGQTGGSKYMQKHIHSTTLENHSAKIPGYVWEATGEAFAITAGGWKAENPGYAGEGDSGNLQPYIVVKRWHRTA